MNRMKLEKKNILKAVISVIVALAFIMPGAASVTNDGISAETGIVGTPPNPVWIDENDSGEFDPGEWNGTKIQDGIDNATNGQTVHVEAGIYDENLYINKSIDLIGNDEEDTIISITVLPPLRDLSPFSSKQRRPIVFVDGIIVNDISVNISGFTVDGGGDLDGTEDRKTGILYCNASGIISDNIVKNMGIDIEETFGITVYGKPSKEVTIFRNNVSGFGRTGIGINGDYDVGPVADVRDNIVTGYVSTVWSLNGIQLAWASTGNIINNTVTHGRDGDEYWSSSGIILIDAFGTEVSNNSVTDWETGISTGNWYHAVEGNDANLLKNNLLKSNDIGIYVEIDTYNYTALIEKNNFTDNEYAIDSYCYGGTPSTIITIRDSSFNNNSEYAVYNRFSDGMGAIYNYWGDASGPYHPTTNPNGLGDNVSDNVEFVPWIGYYSWSVLLNIEEQYGVVGDTAIFGEKPDAFDGQDTYDAVKPNIPPMPYVYAWFDAGLPEPYDRLWEDYRDYPDDSEIWDLYITCNTTLSLASVNLVVSWNTVDINATEYDHIRLYDASDVLLADMKAVESYVFSAEFEYLYHFQIRCSMNNAPIAYDDFYTTIEDGILTVPSSGVLVNDEDVENTPLIALLESDVSNGTLTLNADGSFEYIPSIGFSGDDSFTYKANDGIDNSTPATVTITVLECHQVSLQQYWNLMSLPVSEPMDKTQIVIRSGGTDYTWSEAVSGHIILDNLYDWNTTTQCYTMEPSTFKPGRAYWMWAYQNCEILVYSNDVGTGDIATLQLKWNLIGFPYDVSLVKENLIVNYEDVDYTWDEATTNANPTGSPIVLKFLYGWERTSQRYAYANSFDAGEGYWMYAYKVCTLANPLV